ncbi:MAG TPA: hypothetical protein VGE91_01610 [Solirubrobacterales bacterium]
MDEVSFEFAPAGEDFPDDLRQIKIEVNGVEFPELVREAELPSARADEEEEIAGNYIGLVAGYMRIDLAGQFLGGQGTPMFTGSEKTALLGCGCGDVGCSPLMARITVTDETVTWEDFEQPTRPDWEYDGFGPFRFDRAQYERALMEIGD